LKLHLGKRAIEIVEIEDRWYSPGATYFRVRVEDGDRYVLRHEEPGCLEPGRITGGCLIDIKIMSSV